MTLSVSADGVVNGGLIGSCEAQTTIEGLRPSGEARLEHVGAGDGSQRLVRTLSDGKTRTCTVTERFVPHADGLRWEVEITGSGKPWSAGIRTTLRCPVTRNTQFWTAWSDPEHKNRGWRNPLVMRPLGRTRWDYSNRSHFTPERGDFISVPLATIADADRGVSIVLSPEDHILGLELRTNPRGIVEFIRRDHRLGDGSPLRFSLDLVSHEADWRGGLRFLAARYPQFFDPVNPEGDALAGCGAYSGFEGEVDPDRLRAMAFRFNWKLSDDFPWMGMFVPPVADDDETWRRSCGEPAPDGKADTTSCRQMNDYARRMRRDGFQVLNYFNVTEFGKNMDSRAWQRPSDPARLWESPVHFLAERFPRAVLDPKLKTFYGARVTDCGDPDYQEFLLDQARRHIERLPDTSGICIDRLDWIRFYNRNADDGLSLIGGKPARALAESWKGLMARLGPLMHAAGKVVFVNPMAMRLDLFAQADGFFTEHGEAGAGLNSLAFVALRKTAVTWTCMWWTKEIHELKPDPDRFFQRHLLMGVFPMAPYPYNNHGLRPHPDTDRHYRDYGPLLDAMRGKKWVLMPFCVGCADPAIAVNLFETPRGLALPVVGERSTREAVVELRNLPGGDVHDASVLHPGAAEPLPLPPASRTEDGACVLRVPLVRGCAMVLLSRA